MTYQLEKFDSGPVYFLKQTDESDNTSNIQAIINIQEIRDHAEYQLNIITCRNYEAHNVSLHGSFLNLDSIIQITANIITNNPNIYDNIVRNSNL